MILAGAVAAASGASGPADPVQVQRKRANYSATGEITLDSAPTVGSTLLVFGYISEATFAAPAGWTELAYDDNGSSGFYLGAKVSDGTETTVTVTGASRLEYQEWSGLAPLATIYDDTESIEMLDGGSTSWNPASVTADQDRAVYLALLGMGNSSGTVTSDWSDCDATYNTALLLGGHKIVTDGAAFDTAITWTTSRPNYGGVFVLRGES